MTRYRYAQRGFSLIELMVVVSIIGILGSAAGPAMTSWMVKRKQAEGQNNLHRIHTLQMVYAAEYGTYFPSGDDAGKLCRLTTDIASNNIGFVPEGKDYKYGVTTDARVPKLRFTAVAIAMKKFIGQGAVVTLDRWFMNDRHELCAAFDALTGVAGSGRLSCTNPSWVDGAYRVEIEAVPDGCN